MADDVLDRARKRIGDTVMQQQDQRALSLQARRFVAIPGAQWEGEWGEAFANSIKVQVNKTKIGLRKILNDYTANRIMPTFRAVGNDADDHTAETIGGIHRADSYHFKAQQARDNAFREAVAGGFGAWRLCTDYADPLDPDNDDQRINPAEVIADADQSVFFDPDSKLYDKSDAKWATVMSAMTPDAFTDQYGDDRLTSWPSAIQKPFYDWFTLQVIRVAEYYEVEERKAKLWVFTHRITGDEQRFFDDEIDAGERSDMRAQGYKQTQRDVTRRRVKKWVLSGAEVLEPGKYIAGTEIPIVPMYGDRDYIDNSERVTGHVQDAMDPQRIYNTQVSKLTEEAALAPRAMPIFAPEQMPPHLADLWAMQNIERHPYALVEPLRNVDGSIASLGPIGSIEPPQVSPVRAALIQLTANDIAELTNSEDGADEAKSNIGIEAMELAAQRTDAKSAGYIDNMRQSAQREGEIYLAMAREIYTRPGRVLETVGTDDSDGEETLAEPFTDASGIFTLRNDLSRGKYKVIADVMEATSTQRDKTVRRMMTMAQVQIAAQDQEGSQASLITAAANMDGEGLSEYKKWNRKRGLKIGLFEPTPEEQQELAQAAQQSQGPDPTQVALQAQAMELQSKAALNQAQTQKAAADTEQSQAKTVLTLAQAHALGGPAEAPQPPTGLEAAKTMASIDLHTAQAAKLRIDAAKQVHDAALSHGDHVTKVIRTGHEIEMARRAQDLAERRPAGNA